MNDVSTPGQTGSADRVDRTSTGKEHFEVLDGLRGSAAILIVIFHVISQMCPIGVLN
jgi:peptidoglycan/LPS O-acetylase OafA/YrhL